MISERREVMMAAFSALTWAAVVVALYGGMYLAIRFVL